jgi:hypothetical protein
MTMSSLSISAQAQLIYPTPTISDFLMKNPTDALMLYSAGIRMINHCISNRGHTDTEPPGCINTTTVPLVNICNTIPLCLSSSSAHLKIGMSDAFFVNNLLISCLLLFFGHATTIISYIWIDGLHPLGF